VTPPPLYKAMLKGLLLCVEGFLVLLFYDGWRFERLVVFGFLRRGKDCGLLCFCGYLSFHRVINAPKIMKATANAPTIAKFV
jgi:hypothetical protein